METIDSFIRNRRPRTGTKAPGSPRVQEFGGVAVPKARGKSRVYKGLGFRGLGFRGLGWVLPPYSNSL